MSDSSKTEILIVGSGGNAISPAVLLKEHGFNDFVMISKQNDFGGAWLENSYPGCEVDTPSLTYQFSYALNPNWSALYAKQHEVLMYMQEVARSHGLYEHVHFGTEMLGARWDDDNVCWLVETSQGRYQANVLVVATGFLEEVVMPTIPGMHEFDGRIFHSSRWPNGYSGEGDRVAVVGSGSSAIQIVPEMAKVADLVVQFQRTPTYVKPKNNRLLTVEERALLAASVEEYQKQREAAFADGETRWGILHLGSDPDAVVAAEAASLNFLAEQVTDPYVRSLLVPNHRIACKRPLSSDDYYGSLNAANVRLVPEAATKIGQRSITASGGEEFKVDTIVLATGFYFGGHILHNIWRRDGQAVGAYQAGHPRAYKSVSVAGCPNMFLVGGPAPNGQTWSGLFTGEAAGRYLVKVLKYMRDNEIRALEVREDSELAWKAHADEILDLGPVVSGGCTNYSQDDSGHNKAAWPGNMKSMERELGEFVATDYLQVRRSTTVAPGHRMAGDRS